MSATDDLDGALADLEMAALEASRYWRAHSFAGLGARLFETWAHTVAMIRADLDPDRDPNAVGPITEYLETAHGSRDRGDESGGGGWT